MTLQQVEQLFALASSTWIGSMVVWKVFKKVKQSYINHTDTLKNVSEAVARIEPVLAIVKKEVLTNGGQSFRDEMRDMRNEAAMDRAARRAVSNVASFEISVWHEEPHVLFVSPAWIKLTGLSREDCEHSGWIRAIIPEERDRVHEQVSASMDDETVLIIRYSVRHVHTGEETYVEHTSTPVTDLRGKVVAWIGVVIPVNEE